jgi:hypothetical protein
MQAMGMKLLYKRSNVPNDPSMLARLGYGTEADSTVLELVYKYSQEKASDTPTCINIYDTLLIMSTDHYRNRVDLQIAQHLRDCCSACSISDCSSGAYRIA